MKRWTRTGPGVPNLHDEVEDATFGEEGSGLSTVSEAGEHYRQTGGGAAAAQMTTTAPKAISESTVDQDKADHVRKQRQAGRAEPNERTGAVSAMPHW